MIHINTKRNPGRQERHGQARKGEYRMGKFSQLLNPPIPAPPKVIYHTWAESKS